MTMDFQLAQSPRTQMQVPTQDSDADELFAQGFRQLAEKVLQKSLPELLQNVVTFKVIEANATEAKGIGVFVVRNAQDIIYIPCIVSNNSIKPLDMFYSRTADKFYPLTKDWLKYTTRDLLTNMGTTVSPPKTLQTDVDIRNLIVPPTTGRYSYASEDLMLMDFLKKAPNRIKTAAKELFKKNKEILKYATRIYGANNIKESLVKKAEVVKEIPLKHEEFHMFTKKSPIELLQEKLGPNAAVAYKAIRYHGFYANDMRNNLDDVTEFPEMASILVEPDKSGLYTVFFSDGTAKTALVVLKPNLIDLNKTDEESMAYGYYKDTRNIPPDMKKGAKRKYMVITEDGDYVTTFNLIAEPIITEAYSVMKDFVKDRVKDKPSENEQGSFICFDGDTVKITEAFRADKVNEYNGIIKVNGPGGDVTLNTRAQGSSIFKPKNNSGVMLSNEFKWLKLNKRLDELSLVKNPSIVEAFLDNKILSKGAKKVACVKLPDGTFKVANAQYGLTLEDTVVKLAKDYNIHLNDAIKIVNNRVHNNNKPYYITKKADDNTLQILQQKMQELSAQQEALQDVANRMQQAQPQDPAQMQGQMDPAQMQQDPAQMQQMQQDPAQMQGQMDPAQMQQMQGQMDPAQMQQMQGQMDPAQMQQMQGQMDPAQMQQMQPPMPTLQGDLDPNLINQQINPQFLQDASALDEAGIFDAAAVASLAQETGLKDIIQNYMPTLEKSLDNLGRTILLFQLKENDIKERAGNQIFNDTEIKLRNTFKNLGECLLNINQLAFDNSYSSVKNF